MHYDFTVNTHRVIGTPNPKMWGVFYEEINHAGDGGLYAEMIRNRTFADACLPEDTVYADGKVRTARGHAEDFDPTDALPSWELQNGYGALAAMERTQDAPRNPECPNQLRLTVLRPGTGVRVINRGYWGLALRPIGYNGFIILRGEGITKVTVGLMYKSGHVICSQTLSVGETFTSLPFRLECPAEEADARFFLEAQEVGVLTVDFVSLFPEDACGPFRRDVFDMLKGLKPGFIRFPGGCVVEGIDLENAIHWKKTRGPMEDRPGHWDLWGYRATDGMGMLEFCLLAEMLDADIMYVVNCGMSCQFRKPEMGDAGQVEWWLQNALDGIEYIVGDVSTPFGRLRARDGHPAPFRLKYLEIGNENWGPEYFERYQKFYKVLKQKYPQLTLIANCAVPGQPMDMVDDHYYTPPQTFPTMYDRYEGEGTPVYVGEYACNTDVGYGNLLSAVSDATFMIRMENRCDRIRIASYAPLLCHEKDRKWPVNLINFSNHTVYGIPSYEVQKCFAENAVSRVYAVEGKNPDPTALHITAGQGKDGLTVKLAHFSREAAALTLRLPAGFSRAEVTLLASDDPHDTNSSEAPMRVHTTCAPAQVTGGSLHLTVPAYAFAVVRIS